MASQTHPAKAKAVAPAPKKAAAPAARVAPADEYFGRLKMSILGIRNTLKDLAQKADYDPSNPEQIFGSANFVAPAEAATTVPVPAASNAPAAQATNAPAPAAKPPAHPY